MRGSAAARGIALLLLASCLSAGVACSQDQGACPGNILAVSTPTRYLTDEISSDCLHRTYGTEFVVPDLATLNYQITGYELQQRIEYRVVVFYEPVAADAPLLFISISFGPDVFASGSTRTILETGDSLWITERADAVLGTVQASDTAYVIAVDARHGTDTGTLLHNIALLILQQSAASDS